MFRIPPRVLRWMMMVSSGAMLLQAPSCDLVLQGISTGLLAILTGITFFLARNV